MLEILSLSPHHKKTGWVTVALSNGETAAFSADVAVMFRLSPGGVLEKQLKDAAAEQQRRDAFSYALKYCAGRMTEKETAARLRGKGYPAAAAHFALEKLREYGYAGDARYAESYAAAHGKTKGNRAIAYALKQKGLSDDLIAPVLKDEDTERETCVAAAVKFAKNKDLSDAKERLRLMRHLAYRGFSHDAVTHALRALASPSDTF